MPGFSIALRPVADPEIHGDTASILCELLIRTKERDPQSKQEKVTLQKNGARWLIADVQAR